jgi:hypothetical protein
MSLFVKTCHTSWAGAKHEPGEKILVIQDMLPIEGELNSVQPWYLT